MLTKRLSALGIEIERQVELVDFEEQGAEIRATLRTQGLDEAGSYAYLAGCDGAPSAVREVLGRDSPAEPTTICFMSRISTPPDLR